MGGKSPFIVFDDANMKSAVNASIAGILGRLDKAASPVRASTCMKILQMSFLKR
jgi:NAD-dependent aldehyde dehydrogenases